MGRRAINSGIPGFFGVRPRCSRCKHYSLLIDKSCTDFQRLLNCGSNLDRFRYFPSKKMTYQIIVKRVLIKKRKYWSPRFLGTGIQAATSISKSAERLTCGLFRSSASVSMRNCKVERIALMNEQDQAYHVFVLVAERERFQKRICWVTYWVELLQVERLR